MRGSKRNSSDAELELPARAAESWTFGTEEHCKSAHIVTPNASDSKKPRVTESINGSVVNDSNMVLFARHPLFRSQSASTNQGTEGSLANPDGRGATTISTNLADSNAGSCALITSMAQSAGPVLSKPLSTLSNILSPPGGSTGTSVNVRPGLEIQSSVLNKVYIDAFLAAYYNIAAPKGVDDAGTSLIAAMRSLSGKPSHHSTSLPKTSNPGTNGSPVGIDSRWLSSVGAAETVTSATAARPPISSSSITDGTRVVREREPAAGPLEDADHERDCRNREPTPILSSDNIPSPVLAYAGLPPPCINNGLSPTPSDPDEEGRHTIHGGVDTIPSNQGRSPLSPEDTAATCSYRSIHNPILANMAPTPPLTEKLHSNHMGIALQASPDTNTSRYALVRQPADESSATSSPSATSRKVNLDMSSQAFLNAGGFENFCKFLKDIEGDVQVSLRVSD